MKTVRDILENCAEDYYPYHEFIGAYQDKNKESLDQALKDISELLIECKPEKKKIDHSLLSGNQGNIANGGYNQAIDDYEKNIKEVLK